MDQKAYIAKFTQKKKRQKEEDEKRIHSSLDVSLRGNTRLSSHHMRRLRIKGLNRTDNSIDTPKLQERVKPPKE